MASYTLTSHFTVGTAIGGWSGLQRYFSVLTRVSTHAICTDRVTVNMENFITGYAGHEHQVRDALKQVLGTEKYNYFFEKVCRTE